MVTKSLTRDILLQESLTCIISGLQREIKCYRAQNVWRNTTSWRVWVPVHSAAIMLIHGKPRHPYFMELDANQVTLDVAWKQRGFKGIRWALGERLLLLNFTDRALNAARARHTQRRVKPTAHKTQWTKTEDCRTQIPEQEDACINNNWIWGYLAKIAKTMFLYLLK